MFEPSQYQRAVFDFVKNGKGSAIVEAVAGSGKTTTIVEALKLLSRNDRTVFLAFNKAIADELGKRVPNYVNAMTTHSLGLRAVRNSLGNVQIDGNKSTKYLYAVQSMYESGLWKMVRPKLKRLYGLSKNFGIAPKESGFRGMLPDDPSVWTDIIEEFGIVEEGDIAAFLKAKGSADTDIDILVAGVKAMLCMSLDDQKSIDFDDMLYLPVVMGMEIPKHDNIFLDEAQDIAPIQRELVSRALGRQGRIFAVGDPRQAIYAFRGADSNSMTKFAERFDCTRLPLSISYRCAKEIVKYAQKFVSHIEAFDGAPDGVVEHHGSIAGVNLVPNDLVVCRTNAPVLRLAYTLIARRQPAKIVGRDLANSLVNVIRSCEANSLDELGGKITEWCENAISRRLARNADAEVQDIYEKRDAICTIIELTTCKTVDDMVRELESLFVDKAAGVIALSTIHKAKGLEADRVFWLEHSMTLGKKNEKNSQEDNLKYVATTRAKTYLGLIN